MKVQGAGVALGTLLAETSALQRYLGVEPLRTVSLIAGQDDEAPTQINCVITADTVNFKVGGRGWKMTAAGPTTAQLRLDPPGTDDPLTFPPASAVGLWIYVDDATKATQVVAEIYQDAALSVVWSRSFAPVTGWNFIRWPATNSTITGWGTAYRLRLYFVCNAATFCTVGQMWLECPSKAQVLFIADSCYQSFYDVLYPALKARGFPVTWAPDCTLLGTGAAPATRMSEATLALAAAENNNSVSFHGYDGAATTAYTAAQIRTDTMQAIKWLERRGFWRGRGWRAAWPQNDAPNANAADGLLLAGGTWNGQASATCWPFPPYDRYNVPRLSIHGRSPAAMDSLFAGMEATHGLCIFYTHGIDASGGNYTTPAEMAYLLGKLDAAIAGGWIEGVTLEQLYGWGGGRFRVGFGDGSAEYPDQTATPTIQHLP